jgi:hypothetical protein
MGLNGSIHAPSYCYFSICESKYAKVTVQRWVILVVYKTDMGREEIYGRINKYIGREWLSKQEALLL